MLAEQAVWLRTADVLVETGRCLDTAEHVLVDEIERIRASDDPARASGASDRAA